MAERGNIWGASREELTEKGGRKVSVLPCTKDFGECVCFVDTTDLDVVKELGSSGRRFLWFLVSNPTTNESLENLEHMSLPSVG